MTVSDLAALHPLRRASAWHAAGGLAVAAGVLAAFYWFSYHDCLANFFHFDDFWVLAAAGRIHLRSPADVAGFFAPVNGFILYRPVSTLVYFYALREAFGYDPTGYHATQLAFHVINALLVYAIADSLFFSRPLGLATAVVYATAPGHAIAVYWNALFTITGTAVFYFLALWAWLRLDSRWRVLVVVLLFTVDLMASEHAVSLPLALTLATVVLPERCDWRRSLVELTPFYVIGGGYVGAKLYYLHYLLPAAMPDPVTRAIWLAGYQVTCNPLTILEHLGRYVGFAVDVIYRVPMTPLWAMVLGCLVGVVAVVSTLCVLTGKWTARALRVATFGVDLFIVGLGQVLVLRAHVYSYYVGIGGIGLALALVGFAAASTRLRVVGPALVVAALVATHVYATRGLVQRSEEFRFFYSFTRAAAEWLYTVRVHASRGGIDEFVVPNTGVTHLVFDVAESQKLLLCGDYGVRTASAIDEVEPVPGRLILRNAYPLPMPLGAARQWFWIPTRCQR